MASETLALLNGDYAYDWSDATRRLVLDSLASDDVDDRRLGAELATHLTDDEALVVSALDDDDPRVRVEAVRAAAPGTVTAATDRILAWAGSEATERDLRLEWIVALGQLPGDSVAHLLEELANEHDEEIAELAAMALDEHSIWSEILDDEE